MERDYDPLLSDGFQEIALWQLDAIFLEPFGGNEHRKMLIDRLKEYLKEVEAIRLPFEVWIDGSFVTKKPEPSDVDLVLLFSKEAVDKLELPQASLFSNLVMEREVIKARYSCDVYFIDLQDFDEREKWKNEFGRDRRKILSKGMFVVRFGNV